MRERSLGRFLVSLFQRDFQGSQNQETTNVTHLTQHGETRMQCNMAYCSSVETAFDGEGGTCVSSLLRSVWRGFHRSVIATSRPPTMRQMGPYDKRIFQLPRRLQPVPWTMNEARRSWDGISWNRSRRLTYTFTCLYSLVFYI